MKSYNPASRFPAPDILRGIALFGICLANYPVFSLHVFQDPEILTGLPGAFLDPYVDFLHYTFIDGKFYSLFSLLFGFGFYMMLDGSVNGNLGRFYRRLFILAVIGFLHCRFIWMGDILLLYAILGLFLPLFRKISDRNLILIATGLILSPILIDSLKYVGLDLTCGLRERAFACYDRNGITRENFGTFLLTHDSWTDIWKTTEAGIYMRYHMLLDSNRAFKVFGLFLIGYWMGRRGVLQQPENHLPLLKRLRRYGLLFGIPLSVGFAWAEDHLPDPPDAPVALLKTVAYAVSVVPLAIGYLGMFVLASTRFTRMRFFAFSGRMPLTNYLSQSFAAIYLFYGVGLGLALKFGLIGVWATSIAVCLAQMIISRIWLQYFHFGPLEWIWRMGSSGRYIPIRKTAD